MTTILSYLTNGSNFDEGTLLDPKPKRRRRSRHQRRSDLTKQKLLDAARSVFAEKGLDCTRIDEITERADVGKGTFYYHFGSKAKIVREVMRRVLTELTEAVEARCEGMVELPALLDTLIGAHIEFFCSRWEDFVLYFQGRTELTLEEGYPGIEAPFLEYLECVERVLASVIHERLPQPVLRRIACAVAGFVSGYYAFAVAATPAEDVDEAFRLLRGAMVATLTRFVQEAMPPAGGTGPRGADA